MRIAYFVDTFPSISETFILNQLTGVIRRGHEVEIFAARAGDRTVMHADIGKYSLLEKTHYHALPQDPGNLKKALWLAQSGTPILRLLCRRPHLLGAPRRALSPSLWRKAQMLDGACRRYDVIHCHFGHNGALAAELREISALQGPIVTSFHGYDLSAFIRAHGSAVYRFLFARGDLFLPVSERFRQRLLALGCPAEKIRVHRVGVDLRRRRPRPRCAGLERPVRILTIARLVEKKGVAYGIEAAARLAARYPGVEYRIAGDGPLKASLQELIHKLNVKERVFLLGWQNQQEVRQLLRHADILLAPSVSGENGDEEGTPTVLIEALAHGIPVVSTRHSGISEVVPDGAAGYLVPERDAPALAEKLALLIEHRGLWPVMGAAGRRHVEAHFDIEKLNERLIQIYGELADANVGAAQIMNVGLRSANPT
jgi:colanic acid/amylovoran biosynthesis glycosyltransferase